jgi:putative membrane protein
LRNLLVKGLVTAAALWVAIWIVDGLRFADDASWLAYAAVTALLVVVNTWVKPVMKMLGLPFIVVTLGLFLLVINALALQVVVWLSSALDLGFTSTGFFWATFLGALVISVVSAILNRVVD